MTYSSMNNKKKFLTGVLTAILFVTATTSCNDYLDVNTDPNNPTTVTPDLVLPAGQTYTAFYIHGDRRTNHLGNMFMYNWSESNGFSWYNDEFQYLVTTTFYATLFDQAYTRALKQYHLLTELEDAKFNNYIAVGKIMKAYHFQLLVDFYGDIPYTEALGRSALATPKYDDGQVVYNDLLVQLTEAIALIKAAEADPTAVAVGTEDVMFEGDMTRWIQFANSLKVRILTRMSGGETVENGDQIAAELAVIEAEGTGFLDDDVIVDAGYLAQDNKQNPFWDSFGAGPDGSETMNFRATCATAYTLSYLDNTGDARIGALYEYEDEVDGFLGVDQIAEPGPEYSYQFVSNIGPGLLKGATMGSNIFTLAESKLNLAELAHKGLYTAVDAETLYNEGIAASYAYLELGAADLNGYLTGGASTQQNVAWDSSPNKLQAIITQKWIAVNGITAEQSWFDYSRTGYPANLPIADEATASERPVRLFYPASERSSNSANVPAQPNAFTAKIFWAE
jgi:hypothetical protein